MATLALHAIPLILLWAQWQQWRLDSAAYSKGRTMEVRLQTPSASVAGNVSERREVLSNAVETREKEDLQILENTVADVALDRAADNSPNAALIYLPPSELDIRPEPETPLAIPFPDTEQIEGMVSAVLTLYIGLEGKVERIEISESTLPPEFERVARETFMHAAMRPGIKGGSIVRSMMKIVVEFESRPAF